MGSSTPGTLALVASLSAAVAALVAAVITLWNGSQQRRLERHRETVGWRRGRGERHADKAARSRHRGL
jgi:HAMP domain-containing protein